MAISNQNQRQERINRNEDFAYSILWSPLPMISWVLPFIGHLAIADSTGVASDFQGPYFVGDKGFLAFGRATRVLTLDVSDLSQEQYDQSIQTANEIYRGRMHNLFCDNCHSHVAYALNDMGFQHKFLGGTILVKKWDMVKLCFWVFLEGRFVDKQAIVAQFAPFVMIVAIWVGTKYVLSKA